MTDPSAPTPASQPERRWHLLAALLVIALAVAAVALLLPVVLRSLLVDSRETGSVAYNLSDGAPLPRGTTDLRIDDTTFIGLTLTSIDVDKLEANVDVRGRRACDPPCSDISLALYGIPSASEMARGMAHTILIDLPQDTRPFTESVQLPLSGIPERFPFDQYHLELGVGLMLSQASGEMVNVTAPATVAEPLQVSLEDRVPGLAMSPPTPIDRAAFGDGRNAQLVDGGVRLVLTRPVYSQVIAVILVLLVTASGFLSLFNRSPRDTILGIGGLVLGIWGIRSIVVPYAFPRTTAVDLLLSFVILLLALTALVRSGQALWQRYRHPAPDDATP